MKKILFLFSVVSSFLFTACSKDVEDRLPGTWNFETTHVDPKETVFSKGTMTFNEDGSGFEESDGDTENFTWKIDESSKLIFNEFFSFTNEVNEKDKQVFSGDNLNDAEFTLTLTK